MDSSNAKMKAFGSEWAEAGAEVVEFKDLEAIYGLKFISNESGKVISTTLDGEPIALEKALLLRGKLAIGRVWFEFASAEFKHKNLDPVLANHLIELIKKQINEDAYHG